MGGNTSVNVPVETNETEAIMLLLLLNDEKYEKTVSLPFLSLNMHGCKHLNSVETKRLLDSRFNIVSAARHVYGHASSKVNATDLKFKFATLEFEELKSN